jgi:hypothetical protein
MGRRFRLKGGTLSTRTFEEWVSGIFDHPVREPAWYWDPDADTCEEDDETNVDYLARLFTDIDFHLRRFDNAQVGQGLNMIVCNSCSNHAYSLVGGRAPWPRTTTGHPLDLRRVRKVLRQTMRGRTRSSG